MNMAAIHIVFPEQAAEYCASNLTVVFPALVDGRPVACAISVEALEDHFAVRRNDRDGWLRAFESSRNAILITAREHLELGGGAAVLLKSGHFPFPPPQTGGVEAAN
jgi:hypothetical protein